MKFGGFQKLTLLDYPGKVACTLFVRGCNFRCPFCHNTPLLTAEGEAGDFDEAEVLSYLNKRAGIIEGVCITGGEPLLHPELTDFIRSVKQLGYAVKLDTNGSLPDRLKALVAAGLLDYVAMDIKNALEKYPQTAGVAGLDTASVEASIDLLLSDVVDYEFRTTVAEELHTAQDIGVLAGRIAGAKRYFLQNFVDSGQILAGGLRPVSPEKLEAMRLAALPYVETVKIR